jgi:hypothetical protein
MQYCEFLNFLLFSYFQTINILLLLIAMGNTGIVESSDNNIDVERKAKGNLNIHRSDGKIGNHNNH